MRISIVICLLFAMNPVRAKQNWWESMMTNLKKAVTPSEFICDRYERRPYEINVLKPGIRLPFTERALKKRHCIKWEDAPDSAIGKTCVEYAYENSTEGQHHQSYEPVTRYRTVCVEGHHSK